MRLPIETGAPKMKAYLLSRLPGTQRGQSMVEYAIVAAIVLAVGFLVYRRRATAKVTPRADDSTR